MKGLGDAVAAVTSALGIKPCGGCKGRQEILNKLVPFRAPSAWEMLPEGYTLQLQGFVTRDSQVLLARNGDTWGVFTYSDNQIRLVEELTTLEDRARELFDREMGVKRDVNG